MKFFLTTAIDFVNSRPHLGTAYEKITADVIARYKRLAGFDTWFLMGNDEHSQNVFRRAQELGQDPLAYCDEMERVFTGVWKKLDVSYDDFIRTTDTPSSFSGRAEHGAGLLRRRRHLRRPLRRVVLRQLRGVQAGEGSDQRPLPGPSDDQARVDQGEELVLPVVEVSAAAADHYARQPSFIEPEVRRNEILRLVEAGLEDISVSRAGQSWGIPLPFDPQSVVYVWFDALDQLRGGRRLRLGPTTLRGKMAGRPAHHRQGHHAVPLRDLAGDADEREAAAARTRLRPRLDFREWPAHEQVARQRRRSRRGGRAIRRRPVAPVSHEGSALRRRRRLQLRAAR